MLKIKLITTARTYELPAIEGTTLLETFRANNIPIQGTMPLNSDNEFLSLSHTLIAGDEITAYSLRNMDFNIIKPSYTLVSTTDPVAELIRPLQGPDKLGLVQFNRKSGIEFIYQSVKASLNHYRNTREHRKPIQIALSPGGDGRVLIECIKKFWEEYPEEKFHAVIVAVGFEDENEHLTEGIKLAERYKIPYEAFGVRDAANILGYEGDLNQLSQAYKSEHPLDEAEIMLTYWVQNVNFSIAKQNQINTIIFGYNQEDVIAERLYQAMTGKFLQPFPVRKANNYNILAPLAHIPKKLLDAMDVTNSIRNYGIRSPSVSYLRSSLYLLSYLVTEQFPAIADVLSGEYIEPKNPDDLLSWLQKQ